ncbi:unnamed protein product [Allacma fusca]|uniref:cyclin-dependent kinase n=1 Tax=Allacma fusca TaxID=39272 RepID=A0A8J2LN02_9HEXA|nr:unnamed protein product [Allacma fusca]
MSNFTSDEEMGDELEIKPPQAQIPSRERRRDRGDRYRRPKNKDYRRSEEERRSRRKIEFDQAAQQSRFDSSGNRQRYPGQVERVERERLHGRRTERESGGGGSRHSRKHGDKYPMESKPGERREDRRRELQEQQQKRLHIEQEEKRFFQEVKRKRDMEKEEIKRQDEKKARTKSRSPSPLLSKSDLDEELVKPKSEKSKDTNDSSSLFPEVEDIEESSSELEEGEQTSPIQTNSDVSASDNEKYDMEKPDDENPSPRSVASDSRSSSASPSDSNSKESTPSKSSDSENDAQDEQRNGGRDAGDKSQKGYKLGSPVSPETLKNSKASPSTEGFESDHGKPSQGGSEVIDVEEATDILSLLPPYYPAIQGCRRVEEFHLLNRIEEGTYGVVYRAKDKRTNEIVALKKLKMEKEKDGFPITSLREINTLLKAQHENIVTVREIVVGSNTDKIFLVMDYVEHDLKSLMETVRQKERGYNGFVMGEVKCLMKQLLAAVAHLHDNWILHRDLKTSNLLLSHKGVLKVGDFGLAREYGSPLKQYTPIVVTLWYRAPELLLGMREYSTPIDIWSVGCIFGELLKMEPMFPGKSEANQLNLIFQTLGTPNDKIWPGYSQLPVLQRMTFADYPVNKLKTRFHILSETGIDLMNKFLTFNPAKRITAEDALKHKFFKEPPLPTDPSMFPTWPAKSELGHRKAAASPKPPSGGRQFKDLRDEDSDSTGFFLGIGDRRPPIGPGFNLKF